VYRPVVADPETGIGRGEAFENDPESAQWQGFVDPENTAMFLPRSMFWCGLSDPYERERARDYAGTSGVRMSAVTPRATCCFSPSTSEGSIMKPFKPVPAFSALVGVFMASAPVVARAQAPPSDDGLFYYAIGGGSPILPPASTDTETVTIGASVAWGSNLTCGAFDPLRHGLNQLNGVTEGFQQMMSNVLQAATAAVAPPGLILQRASPGLYD
jgi:hypothetical protein